MLIPILILFVVLVVWLLFRRNAELLAKLFEDRGASAKSRKDRGAPQSESSRIRPKGSEPRPAHTSAARPSPASQSTQSVNRAPSPPASAAVDSTSSGRAQSMRRDLSPPLCVELDSPGSRRAQSIDRSFQIPTRDRDVGKPRKQKVEVPQKAAKRSKNNLGKSEKQDLLNQLSGHELEGIRKISARSATAPSHEIRDMVDCSVFAPHAVPPMETFLVQAFIHLPEQSKKVKSLARQIDSEAAMRGFKSLEVEIERGTRVSLHLSAPGLEVDEAVQSITWRGLPEAVQFAVSVPASHAAGSVISTLSASLNGIPIGHIKFKLMIKPGVSTSEVNNLKPSGSSARHYEKAFISYASADRKEVLKRVQMLKNLGIEFFQDLFDLEPGARWERELYRHIDECDLFLLFWSNAARQSDWFLKEVEYALKRKKTDMDLPEILPIPIEGPPPVPPPHGLEHLHFNDYFLYFVQ